MMVCEKEYLYIIYASMSSAQARTWEFKMNLNPWRGKDGATGREQKRMREGEREEDEGEEI